MFVDTDYLFCFYLQGEIIGWDFSLEMLTTHLFNSPENGAPQEKVEDGVDHSRHERDERRCLRLHRRKLGQEEILIILEIKFCSNLRDLWRRAWMKRASETR